MLAEIGLVLAGLNAAAALTTVGNLFFWPRPRPVDGAPVRKEVSALIPARNEAGRVGRCVASLRGQVGSIRVCDDRSTDGTGEEARRALGDGETGEVIQGKDLPLGWVGKPWVCHQLASGVESEWLLFCDADTEVTSGGVEAALQLATSLKADVLTLMPRQTTESFWEVAVVPMLHVIYSNWILTPLVWLLPQPSLLAANGQFLLVRRATYSAVGGFASVGGELVDDMAFCRRVKQHGGRVVFGDGNKIVRCRMYRNRAEVWEGFSKNLFSGLGASVPALALVTLLLLSVYTLPALLLPFAWAGGAEALVPIAGALALGLLTRAAVAARHGHPAWTVAALPLSGLAIAVIGLNSLRWSVLGRVRWKGRTYNPKSLNLTGAPSATPLNTSVTEVKNG